jgi:hypothetical protein
MSFNDFLTASHFDLLPMSFDQSVITFSYSAAAFSQLVSLGSKALFLQDNAANKQKKITSFFMGL